MKSFTQASWCTSTSLFRILIERQKFWVTGNNNAKLSPKWLNHCHSLLLQCVGVLVAPYLLAPTPGVVRFCHFFFISRYRGEGVLFWPHLMAYGILVPPPGIKPVSPALKTRSLNLWTAQKVLRGRCFNSHFPLNFRTYWYLCCHLDFLCVKDLLKSFAHFSFEVGCLFLKELLLYALLKSLVHIICWNYLLPLWPFGNGIFLMENLKTYTKVERTV